MDTTNMVRAMTRAIVQYGGVFVDFCEATDRLRGMDSPEKVQEAIEAYLRSRKEKAYPITAKLEEELEPYLHLWAVRQIVDVVGEYEHGTADVEDVEENLTLEQYAAVSLDLAMALGNLNAGPQS